MDDVAIIMLVIIVVEQFKRGDPIKIFSNAIYFFIVYELYEFQNNAVTVPVMGTIIIFLFYECLELLDRKVISKIAYIIVGVLCADSDVERTTYTIMHWLVVRMIILYAVLLPLFDRTTIFLLLSFIGLVTFIAQWFTNEEWFSVEL